LKRHDVRRTIGVEMKLEDFVAETLQEIVAGIIRAQEYAKSNGGEIVPTALSQMSEPGQYFDHEDGSPIEHVRFDVAVNTDEGTTTEGGIGVFVGPLALGSRGQSDASSHSAGRIQFAVPVKFPKQTADGA